MEVYRFIKSNIKSLILSLSIIQAISISYICFLSNDNLTLIDFFQLIPAVTLAIWILPFQYSYFLRLKFSFWGLKKILISDDDSTVVSKEEIEEELKSVKLKFVYFYSFLGCFAVAEFVYILKIVLDSSIKTIFI